MVEERKVNDLSEEEQEANFQFDQKGNTQI